MRIYQPKNSRNAPEVEYIFLNQCYGFYIVFMFFASNDESSVLTLEKQSCAILDFRTSSPIRSRRSSDNAPNFRLVRNILWDPLNTGPLV